MHPKFAKRLARHIMEAGKTGSASRWILTRFPNGFDGADYVQIKEEVKILRGEPPTKA